MGQQLNRLKFKKSMLEDKDPQITFGDMITKAKGGDLILIQDQVYFDNYTMMNSQESHLMKQLVRFKCRESPPVSQKLWSRLGIVVDTEIEDVKYLLEITGQGFKQYEFISRMMYYKNENQVVAIQFYNHAASEEVQNNLINIAKYLSGKQWKQIFNTDSNKEKAYVQLVKRGFKHTNTILKKISVDSFISQQLYQIFLLFTKNSEDDDINLIEKQIQFADLGNYISFLMINQDEREMKIQMICDQIEPLLKQYKNSHNQNRGLPFEAFLQILSKVDVLMELELTSKERISVLSAQVAIEILLEAGFFLNQDMIYEAEDCNDIDERKSPFKEVYILTKVIISQSLF
ncbi:UNKNOWN [Stylonychia lemnae]|uniref:Uncharacterized protein n=1 Tax=Stylonychia lemnae TaxID=5949 RepID=A0A078AL01_STYLE|nr:UNKNOWN [Stylonychia lemnae]|eukprot:CDW81518.1 UNKNOWN [Stylonychia lemnae]